MIDKQPPRSSSPLQPVIVASFTSREAAERRVAGVAAIARVVGEAGGAGAAMIWLVLDDPEELSDSARDDVSRACAAGAQLRWLPANELAAAKLAGDAPGFVLLGGDTLVLASTLRSFLGSGNAQLRFQGRVVARRLDRGGNPVQFNEAFGTAPADAIISLDEPRQARRLLLRRHGVKATDGIVSRWINRPISRAITGALVDFPRIRPSHLTLVTAVLGLLMFLALAFGGSAGLAAGGVLFQLASIVDGVDGELARTTYRTSAAGAAMDTAVDMATNLLFFVGLTIGLSRVEDPAYLLVGGVGVAMMGAGILIMMLLVRRSKDPTSFDLLKHFYGSRFTGGAGGRAAVLLKIAFSRDLFAFLFALMLVVGLGSAVIWIFATSAGVWLFFILAAAPAILFGRSSPGREGA